MKDKLIILYTAATAFLSFFCVNLCVSSPYLAIGQDQWQDALEENIRLMEPNEWEAYITSWQSPTSGEPYPSTTFYSPELNVYAPPPSFLVTPANRADFDDNGTINMDDLASFCSQWLELVYDYSFLDAAGLVMAWGPNSMSEGETSASAWVFEYDEDPSLRNTIVEIEVQPTSNITIVSFGFRDNAGKRRAWWWDCGSGKPVDGRTKLEITTDQAGNSTAKPQTTNSLDEPGFQIDNVVSVIADEQNTWRAARAVPPPGQTVPKAWNYWYNLLITPIPAPDPFYYKWRQPARYISNPGNVWGWDEKSINHEKPLLADDWLCLDDRPITDIHWWGSFPHKEEGTPGWIEPVLPPNPPDQFHFGIWTDRPGDRYDMTHPSEPNIMIWEYTCDTDEYNYKFFGYDRDPNDSSHPVTDACFQFGISLPESAYFQQDPNIHAIYWLSIAAVYNEPNAVEYVWGWKTRPHYFNDDAVRITKIDDPWPPVQSSACQESGPLECPEWCSWDLAFELTTNEKSDKLFP